MIPKVDITLQSGALGAVGGTEDGVAGLVIGCDPGTSGIAAGTKFILRSIDDAKTANLDAIPYAYQQIAEFYAEAGTGAKLYVLISANTETLANIALKSSTNKYAKTLLDYAQGEIKLLGICRKPAAGYTPTTTNGIDADSYAAATNLQALAADYQAAFKPFVGIVEGRSYTGTPASLTDLGTLSQNYVALQIGLSNTLQAIDASAASVGLALGRAAAVPVQRKIARVKDGALSITGGYIGSLTVQNADWASVAEKGFIVFGQYANKSGIYFVDDTLATATTDDYKTISMRRTINKMVRIVYATYINELNDDIELTAEGKLTPATAKYYEGLVKNAVNLQMTANGELSNFDAFVDVNQNVLSTSKVVIKCAAVPKGYSQEINVTLGFSNPALSV